MSNMTASNSDRIRQRDPIRRVNALCAIQAIRILAESSEDDDLRSFAEATVFQFVQTTRISMNENFSLDDVMREAVRQLELEEHEGDIDFIAAFCQKMFAAVYFERSNCKKASLFSIFQQAAENLALDTDDPCAEALCEHIARADISNGALFKETIVNAFARSKFSRFKELRAAIEKEEADESLRAFARSIIQPRKLVLDTEAKRLMSIRIPVRRNLDNPISRREVAAALASRRKKPR
jgi:hypothetical protein